MSTKTYPVGVRKVPPMHPGVLLASLLCEMRVLRKTAAKAMGLSVADLRELCCGRIRVTHRIARSIGHLIGNGPRLWINLQHSHDLWWKTNRRRTKV